MPDIDSNDSFIHMWFIWRFVGIHPFANHKWLYIIYSVFVNLTASITSPTCMFLYIFIEDDIELIWNNLQTSLTLLISSVKEFVIFFNISNLRKVKLYLDRLDRRAERNEEEVQYIKDTIKQCRFIALTIEVIFGFSFATYSIPALIQWRLLFGAWFPFNWSSSEPSFTFVLMFQLFSTAFQIVQNTGNDAYPPIYINILKGHIRALCMRVSRIGKDSRTTPEENYIELVSCINDHKDIIRLFETIRPVIGQTVFLQFSITAFVLCVTVVNFISFDRDLHQVFLTIFYLMAILVESFPVCHLGNALISETEKLSTAIYSCNWMDQSIKFRKCIVIFMHRSQKTNSILAGGLASITLQTFISIVRFSFSTFTLLSQMR